MKTQSTYVPAFGRLLIAVIFIVSSLGKIAAPAMTHSYFGWVGLPAPLFSYLVAIVVARFSGRVAA
jgi:putative oxidoreductase